jgi:ribosomal subunit interface protein
MQLILKGKPRGTLTPELETYAREKFLRLDKHLPLASTVEVVFYDERGQKGGVDKGVRVTITHPKEKNPIHIEEITEDFRSSVDLAQDRTERTVRKMKEKSFDFHRRVLGRSQQILSDTARQTSAIPAWMWKTVRRQLSRRGWQKPQGE